MARTRIVAAALAVFAAGFFAGQAFDDSSAEATPNDTTPPPQARSVEEAPRADPVTSPAAAVASNAEPQATASVPDAPRVPPRVETVRRPNRSPARDATPPAQPTSAPKAPAKTRPNVYEIR